MHELHVFWECSMSSLARIQSPKLEENLRSNIFINFYQADMCKKYLPKFIMRIIYKSAVVNKKKHWGLPVGFRQNKSWEKARIPTFINVSIVILMLFC